MHGATNGNGATKLTPRTLGAWSRPDRTHPKSMKRDRMTAVVKRLGKLTANMSLATGLRQIDLLLSLSKARRLVIGVKIDTTRAGNALLVVLGGHVLGRNRMAAGVALLVLPLFEPVVHRDAVVEHETLTLPAGFLGCNVL